MPVKAAARALGTGAAGTAIAITLIAETSDAAPYPPAVWIPMQAVGLSFLSCGTVLWIRWPGNGTGRLMTLLGVVWYIGDLQLVDHPVVFAASFCLYYTYAAVLGHLVLAIPSGRLQSRSELLLVAGLYAAPPVTQTLRLVAEYPPQPQGWGDPNAAYSLWAPVGSLTMLVLAAVVVVVLVRRWSTAGRAVRREYAPVWLTMLTLGVATAAADLAAMSHSNERSTRVLAVVYAGGMIVVPIALAAGLLRVSLARLSVAKLVVRLQTATEPEKLRAAVAEALNDPALEILYRQPDGDGFVDATGRPATPMSDRDRAVTPIGPPDQPHTLLVHDAGLASQRALVDAVVAAAHLALDNARLVTDQRALLDEVRDSRARIVVAADAERRRIQRDLHDGVQHDLLTLSVLLRQARERLARGDEPADELDIAAHRLPELVRGVRALTEGIHPPALAEQGLAVALEVIAERAPLPVLLDVADRRWPEHLERAAWFVATEALSNVYKHSAATRAVVTVCAAGGGMRITISDDGIGCADPSRGSGLHGLHDRVAALGGTVTVSSRPGRGTAVTAELPCAS